MRIVLQVVSRASVTVEDQVVGAVSGPGLLALVGVTHTDTPETARMVAEKIATLRVLPGEVSCVDRQAPVLVVSQFTLYGSVRKGRRPSWSDAAPGPVSEPLVDEFARVLGERGLPVETGRFGAMMDVELVNTGPYTLVIDSADLTAPRRG